MIANIIGIVGTAIVKVAVVFFASPFWKKLQSKNGQPCMSKKDKVARIPGTHGAGMNPLQTGYLYQR